MRYRIAMIIAGTAIGVALLAAAGVAAVPVLRHGALGWWNNPEGLPALPEHPVIHYESGGSEYARTVAALLPAALARVEAAQGRPFAHPVSIGVYTTRDAFVAANGLGDRRAVGMTFLGRVMLSPVLFSPQRQRLPALLTHELSHAHLQSWMSQLAYWRLPQWFKEGLAVMVSGGGGAEGVSESQARDAIRRGDHIAIASSASTRLLGVIPVDFGVIRFAQPPDVPDTSFRIMMGYRQAGMFVTFLRDIDPARFARMMNAILDDQPFAEAVTTVYGTDLPALWLRFSQAQSTAQ
jgi:hypothetical protein